MAEAKSKRSVVHYWSLLLVVYAAAFIVALAVAYVSVVWVMGGRMGEIEGVGKYVATIVSLVCACATYVIGLRLVYKHKPKK
jgi:hypothetical protein